MKESNYIRYRKTKAMLNSLCFYICRIFPIDKNLISLCTFEGKGGFGCNPKYIAMELNKRNPNYKFVWLVNEEAWDKEFPDYIKKVNNSSIWSRAYWLTRSKVWIDNYRKPLGTVKRKNQYYINVNHFNMGIKCTGLLRGDGFSEMARLVNQNDSDIMDALIIDSKWCEDVFPKAMLYNGPFMKTGAPRCDVLYGDREQYREIIRKKHNLPDDAKILLFAPTFREGADNGKRFVYSEEWTIDFKRLIKNLEMRFGGEWYICFRVHPQLAKNFKGYTDKEVQDRMFDESLSDDMYEILAGSDAYITDYSSACFEAGYANIPVFIYADDIKEFSKARGNLYYNFDTDPLDDIRCNGNVMPGYDVKFPFPIATNNEELERIIQSFDDNTYKVIQKLFAKKIGLIFDGKASARVADYITEKLST